MTLLDAAAPRLQQFTCGRSDSLFVAIERCLDNGLGTCFLVEEDQSLVGRITLDDIRRVILDGSAFSAGDLDRHCRDRAAASLIDTIRLPNDDATNEESVTPIIDYKGRLIDVQIDRTKSFVQVARPDLSHHEFRAVLDAFVSSWISSRGPYVGRFEQEFAAFVGMDHGLAVTNGTVALHLALLALGVGAGDEVIVPDLTFAATVNAVLYCNATPVIVDVDPTTWTMSLEQIERAFTPRTKAIIPVHLYGRPAAIGPIVAFARERGCHVIEDCAEAHGARYQGRAVGQFGDVSCFSFYANKIVTTGEGGMCLTNSADLAATIHELRDHGAAPGQSYWHERVGYNYRMTNLQAAIGSRQLWRIDETLARNQRLEQLYRHFLADIPGVSFPPSLPEDCEPVVWLVSVRVPVEARNRLIKAAHLNDIELRPFFNSISSMPPYDKYARSCPHSMALSRTGILLPTSSAVDEQVAAKIAGIFRDQLTSR
jgi:perosamine synthetase